MWVKCAKGANGKPRMTKLYMCWRNMKHRCLSPKHNYYHRYGGRGIKICKEWREDFAKFREWAIQNGVAKGLTLDRIDNDGDYEPSNCQWIPQAAQGRNRSVNKLTERDAERIRNSDLSDSVLAKHYGVWASHITRIKSGEMWAPLPNGDQGR